MKRYSGCAYRAKSRHISLNNAKPLHAKHNRDVQQRCFYQRETADRSCCKMCAGVVRHGYNQRAAKQD